MTFSLEQLKNEAASFHSKMAQLRKTLVVDFPWYPYDIISNIWHIDPMLVGDLVNLLEPAKTIADIGAADGDLSFFLETLGHRCDIYDNPATNMNGLRGAEALKKVFQSDVKIISCDLDTQFEISKKYDLIIFLGILYHLKNPFFVLEKLATLTKYMFVSTRIARQFTDSSPDVSGVPLAYLVAPDELNNDPTNFWIFTESGLNRIFQRTGWDVVGFRTVGDTVASTPNDNAHDERAFAVLRSKVVTQ